MAPKLPLPDPGPAAEHRADAPRSRRAALRGLGALALTSPALYGLAGGFASPAWLVGGFASPALAEQAAAEDDGDAASRAKRLADRLAPLRVGAMRKLEPASAPEEMPVIGFNRADGSESTSADWRGRALLINFWATWCAPCVTELPSIDALAARVAEEGLSDRVAVLAISVDRGSPERPRALFEKIGVTHLEMLQDPSMTAPRALKLTGMPTTILVDPQGYEVARLLGDADWASGEAFAVIETLADATAPA